MKKSFINSLLAIPFLLGFACQSQAGISTTKHNLSVTGTGTVHATDQTEICIFCHTPHAAIKNANIPLWNHTLSTVASYGVYASPSFNALSTDIADIGNAGVEATAAVSNLCLSCHDGTVAINAISNTSNARPTTTMTGGSGAGSAFMPTGAPTNFGSDLTRTHPINFTYNTALTTNTNLYAPGTLVNPVDASGSGLGGPKLFSGKVQCASCHDPHTSQDSTGKAFVRVTMDGSQLCFKCHSK